MSLKQCNFSGKSLSHKYKDDEAIEQASWDQEQAENLQKFISSLVLKIDEQASMISRSISMSTNASS